MKLVRKSGSIKCNEGDDASYWGCRSRYYGNNSLLTIITNASKKPLLPPTGDLKANGGCNKPHFYRLNGTTHTSPELVFSDLSNPLSVSRNQEFRIWYGQDRIDCWENTNSGKTCVDVYAWYA